MKSNAGMMKSLQLFLHLLLLLIGSSNGVNNRPIIGILGMSAKHFHEKLGDEYIEAAYVKYLEGAGAQVVPVRGNQSESYYQDLFKQINGVLFPGGFNDPVYARSGEFMFKMAVKANLAGDFFPIWGTCEGFELLTYLPYRQNVLNKTDTEDIILPLHLTDGAPKSRLFKDMPEELVKIISSENVTQNSHQWSLLLETYHATQLHEFYDVLSTNISPDNKQFVSTMEAKVFPFYGTQWHPEKNMYLWTTEEAINHSLHAVQVSQYMANFFVNEARKSTHSFDVPDAKVVIENYKRTYKSSFKQGALYFFNYHDL